MEKPCIVCEENCPVTPKAISVSAIDSTVPGGVLAIAAVEGATVRLKQSQLQPGRFGSGDYTVRLAGESRNRRVVANTADSLTLDSAPTATGGEDAAPEVPATAELQVRLQRPVVDPARCIGCGVCEHECPLTGLRGIRITADNETRGGTHGVLLKGAS
jgi:ferredoxin